MSGITLRHFATIDLPWMLDEKEVTEQLMFFANFCVQSGWISPKDLPRIHFFGFALADCHTVLQVYVEVEPESPTVSAQPPSRRSPVEPEIPPAESEPTAFDPKAIKPILDDPERRDK